MSIYKGQQQGTKHIQSASWNSQAELYSKVLKSAGQNKVESGG